MCCVPTTMVELSWFELDRVETPTAGKKGALQMLTMRNACVAFLGGQLRPKTLPTFPQAANYLTVPRCEQCVDPGDDTQHGECEGGSVR